MITNILSLVSGWKLYIGIAAVSAVAFGLVINKAYNAGEDKANAEWLQKELKRSQLHAEQLKKQQEEIAKLNANLELALKNTKTIVKETEKKVEVEVEKKVYVDCKVPETGTEIANELVKRLNGTRIK